MVMNDNQTLMAMLREEYSRWEGLQSSMSEEEICAPDLPGEWSVKDVIAHLMAWQQVSIAQLEAALLIRIPEFPMWLARMDPFEAESEDHREWSWASLHRARRAGFLRFMGRVGHA
jgi:hypothetical protein